MLSECLCMHVGVPVCVWHCQFAQYALIMLMCTAWLDFNQLRWVIWKHRYTDKKKFLPFLLPRLLLKTDCIAFKKQDRIVNCWCNKYTALQTESPWGSTSPLVFNGSLTPTLVIAWRLLMMSLSLSRFVCSSCYTCTYKHRETRVFRQERRWVFHWIISLVPKVSRKTG